MSTTSSSTPLSPLHHATVEQSKSMKRASRMVSRLGKLSHQRGLFNDPGPEINDMCGVLKRELGALDQGMRALVGAVDALEGQMDGGTGPRSHWKAVLDTLAAHLLVLTRGFQEALRARASTLSGAAAARRGYLHSSWAPDKLPEGSPLFGAPSSAVTQDTHPAALRRRGAGGTVAPPPPLFYGIKNEDRPLNNPPPSENNLDELPPTSGSYAHSAQTLATMHNSKTRAADAQAVEGVIVELGSMFTRMAALVGEQGDTIHRIDADTLEAEANVLVGQEELSKLYESVKKNRGFILRMFGVLVFVILLVKVLY